MPARTHASAVGCMTSAKSYSGSRATNACQHGSAKSQRARMRVRAVSLPAWAHVPHAAGHPSRHQTRRPRRTTLDCSRRESAPDCASRAAASAAQPGSPALCSAPGLRRERGDLERLGGVDQPSCHEKDVRVRKDSPVVLSGPSFLSPFLSPHAAFVLAPTLRCSALRGAASTAPGRGRAGSSRARGTSAGPNARTAVRRTPAP